MHQHFKKIKIVCDPCPEQSRGARPHPSPPPARSVLALFYSVDSGLTFPFLRAARNKKNILAGWLCCGATFCMGNLGYAIASHDCVNHDAMTA
jgi:hypothetical protein